MKEVNKQVIQKVTKILADKNDRWYRLLMLHWSNPELSLQEVGEEVGFAKKQARSQVSRILKDPAMKEALQVLRESLAEEASISREEWNRMQLLVARACIQEHKIEDAEGKKIKIFDPTGANKALDNLAKAEGFYKPKEVKFDLIAFNQDLGDDDN